MKKNLINRIIPLLVVVALALAVSSCNRGVGCPSNFSAEVSLSILPLNVPN